MKKVVAILTSLAVISTSIPSMATAEPDEPVCFADAYGVQRHSPGSYPSWTLKMEGHKGEKCWFPSSRSDKKWHHTKEAKANHKTHKVEVNKTEPPQKAQPTEVRTYKPGVPYYQLSGSSREVYTVEQKPDDFDTRFNAYAGKIADRVMMDRFIKWASTVVN